MVEVCSDRIFVIFALHPGLHKENQRGQLGIDLVKDSGIVAWITGESLCRMTGVVWITVALIHKVILIVFALFLPIG
jgi:hypothetical protein